MQAVIAAPVLDYVAPTLANNSYTGNDTFTEINVSIEEKSLNEVRYNWNGTNYTYFNDSLVLMYNFDNISALGENETHIVDVSNGGNNGTVYNGTTMNLTGGVYNGAFEFDGLDDLIDAGNATNLDLGGDFSIFLWMHPLDRGSSSAPGIISKRDTYASMDWELFYSNGPNDNCNNELCFWWGNSGAFKTLDELNISISLQNWTNIVLTRDGNDWTVYVSGVSKEHKLLPEPCQMVIRFVLVG